MHRHGRVPKGVCHAVGRIGGCVSRGMRNDGGLVNGWLRMRDAYRTMVTAAPVLAASDLVFPI